MKFGGLLLLSSASLAIAGPIAPSQNVRSRAPSSNVALEKRGVQKYLVETAPGATKWVTEQDKFAMIEKEIGFIDITDYPKVENEIPATIRAVQVAFPSGPKLSSKIKPMVKQLKVEPMKENLSKFVTFNNRYFKSKTGAESAKWLLSKVTETVKASGAMEFGATVKPFNHPWGQHSVIAKFPGQSAKTIVLGAHQDSINLRNPMNGRAPGADDDGSGSMTILEAMRIMLTDETIKTGKAPNTVEFHWYAAEEGGLLGSGAIFQNYKQQRRDVRAMLNQDMTGYIAKTLQAGKPEAVGIIQDFVDPGLTKFIQSIVKEYCAIPYVLTKCGYACSDHASASKAGYPSAFAIEAEMKNTHPKIHGDQDTLQYISWTHMLEHAKMSLGLAVELAYANV